MNKDPFCIITKVVDELVHHKSLHREIDISIFEVANDHVVVFDDFVPELSVYQT